MSQTSHRSVLLDHKLVIDGVTFHEHKELETIINEDGIHESSVSHTRAIGNRNYMAKQRIIDGVVEDETSETQMSPEEIDYFKKEWEEKWHPSIAERSTGIMTSFFKKLDNFLR